MQRIDMTSTPSLIRRRLTLASRISSIRGVLPVLRGSLLGHSVVAKMAEGKNNVTTGYVYPLERLVPLTYSILLHDPFL